MLFGVEYSLQTESKYNYFLPVARAKTWEGEETGTVGQTWEGEETGTVSQTWEGEETGTLGQNS